MKPWVSGPKELLEHAVVHMLQGNAFDYRIALISIDNAVELAVKVFLGLPERARGAPGPGRRELEQASQSFPDMLDLLEKHAPDKIVGFDLGDIEWYHRLRNDLYHNGNGITVDAEKVDGYLQLAKVLFERLFGEKIAESASPKSDSIGEFILLWAKLEKRARKLASQVLPKTKTLSHSLMQVVDGLIAKGQVSGQYRSRLERVAQARNGIVHGAGQPEPLELHALTKELRLLLAEMPQGLEERT
jgi:hypothetical protein